MYAILNNDNIILDFDIRDLPVSELVHENFQHLYIEVPEDNALKVGDIWHGDTQTWESVEISPVPRPTPEPNQPTNADIAQLVSDLYADLIIAGVI